MKNLIIAIMVFGLFSNADCRRNYDYRASIRNDSPFRIYYIMSKNYPDTVNNLFEYCGSPSDFRESVKSKETNQVIVKGRWEDRFKENAQGTLMFIIYNADTAQKYYLLGGYNCDSLKRRPDLILKRFDVTLDYFRTNNWTLVFP